MIAEHRECAEIDSKDARELAETTADPVAPMVVAIATEMRTADASADAVIEAAL